MNAMYKTVVFLATTVAMFLGFSSPVVANIEPPDRIVVEKFCGKPMEWVVTYVASWVPNPSVPQPFRVGFVYAEDTLPRQGMIFSDVNRVGPDSIQVQAHVGGGFTINLNPIKKKVEIMTIGIRASHPSGAHYMYLFDRRANMNVSESKLASDSQGNCRRG